MKTTKQQILTAALAEAEATHYLKATRDKIAARAGVTSPLIHHYWATMAQLKRAIVGEAIRCENLTVLAQALVGKDQRVIDCKPALKNKIVKHIRG